MKGIDRAFEKWHAKKQKTRMVNSLAYCAQEVLTAARESEEETAPAGGGAKAPFAAGEVQGYLERNAGDLRKAAEGAGEGARRVYLETAASLQALAAEEQGDLEALEQRLTVMEERVTAAAVEGSTEEQLFEHRRHMERQLAPYRRKMTADQLAMLERQYLARRALETAGLPRLSLFYL